MCIALISTSHPDYPFILVNNRDEYLTRRTARAAHWDAPNTHVIGGRDLERDVRGTWLGITKQGRLAVLTNFREEGEKYSGLKSRGAIVNSFLTTPPEDAETTEHFAKRLVEEVGVGDVGGFSLAFGRLVPFGSKSSRAGIAIVSNRTPDVDGITWIAGQPNEIYGLSNSHYGDRSWPKVVQGEKLMQEIISSNISRDAGESDLVKELFTLLSTDTLPRQKDGEDWTAYIWQLRNSIFIPKVGGGGVGTQPADEIAAGTSSTPATTSHGAYGTQKQTVILVHKTGRVTFVEKTLYDEQGKPLEDSCEEFTFDIEGWNG